MSTDPLQHDPRTKSILKEALYEFLYTPIQKKFKRRHDELIVQNTLLGGYTHKSFMYRNIIYNCDSSPLPRKMNRLVPKMQKDMDDYLRELKELNEKEIPYVVGYINQVLNSSNDLHDYLRLLPPSIHAPIRDLIATCPCRTNRLPEPVVELLQSKNQQSIDLMKQRMITNLLI